MTVLLIFVSRPANTKPGVTWLIDQCHLQELELSSSASSTVGTGTTGRALKEFGPNTFEIMQEIIARRNATLQSGSSSAAAGPRWVLHEVMHGCLGAVVPGNTFSFSIKLEARGAEFRDDKAVLPGY